MAVEEFSEDLYLAKNPDVREAVKRGEFASGLQHYHLFGRNERRPGSPAAGVPLKDEPDDDVDSSVPPRALRFRVQGSGSAAEFKAAGEILARNVFDAMRDRVTLSPNSRFLDFGCGCGRVIRSFRSLSPGELHGTDIDAEAIEWCRQHMADIGKFGVNGVWPPLSYADRSFDFIYSISIFTHLPEDMQTAWLAELCRVAKPNSYAFLTTHGESLAHGPAAETLAKTSFYYQVGPGTEGLPEFYQTAFHSERYIKERWSEFFHIEAILPKYINGHQDLVVCRKRA